MNALSRPGTSASICVQRACRAYENAWRGGQRPSIERFLNETPISQRAEVLAALLDLELVWRGRIGEAAGQMEYQQRFPAFAEVIARAFRTIETLAPEVMPPLPETVASMRETAPHPSAEAASAPAEPNRPAATLPRIPEHEVLRLLGRGGMGVVYLARQVKLGRLVALKMIRGGDGGDPGQTARFLREARAVASLQHPNIVQIHEIGEQAGQPYLSLEYVEGGSLDGKIHGTPQPPYEAAALVLALARAMQAAHQRGIIHRDLKPANVLLTNDGQPKITDFGLAKQMTEDAGQTQTGQIMGSPSYMAPEQAAGHISAIGPATDVYALGAILYELLTGRPPFRGDSILDTLEQVRLREPVPPHALQPRVPRDLETVSLKCLAKDPGRRYHSALALAQDLERFQAGEPILARREGLGHRLWRKARRKPAVTLSMLAAALVIALGYVLFQARDTRRIMALEHDLEVALDAADWTPERVEEQETRIADLERVAPAQGASYRDRLYQRLSSHIEESIRRPRLEPEDVAHLEDLLRTLEERRPESAPSLRRALSQRLRVWESVFDLTAPYSTLPDVLDPGRIRVEEQGLIIPLPPAPAGTAPPRRKAGRLLTHVACGSNVRAEAHFDDSWPSASELGIVLNAEDGHSAPITSVALSPDGKLLASVAGAWNHPPGEIKVWRLPAGELLATRPLDHPGQASLIFSKDGQALFLTPPHEPRVRILEAMTLRNQGEISFPGSEPLCLALSPDGRSLAVGGINWKEKHGLACICDLETRKISIPLQGHTKALRFVTFSPDGRTLATASEDKTIRLWETQTGREATTLAEVPTPASSLAFAPDGTLLVAASAGKAMLWDIATRQPRTTPVRQGSVSTVAFTPEGKLLLTGHSNDGSVRLWDLSADQPSGALPGHGSGNIYLACAGDGASLATGGANRAVRLWDMASLRMKLEFRAQGYTFLLRGSRSHIPDGVAAQPRLLRDYGDHLSLVVLRNDTPLQQKEVRVSSGPLHLAVGREGNRLSFQVNDLPPLTFQDVFPLRRSGVFAVEEWTGARLQRWHALRQAQPATASLLEQGDSLFDRGEYTEALSRYRQQAATAGSSRTVTEEAHYKEGLCLTALQRPTEAAPLFERLSAEAEARWSILATCQLWLLQLRQNHFEEAAVLFESLAVRYRFEELAASIPEEVRQDILRSYSEQTWNVNLFKPDPQRVRNAERAAAVEEFFNAGGSFVGSMKWTLYRAYHSAGQLDKALATIEERVRQSRAAGVFDYHAVMEYSWLLRLKGRTKEALAEVDRCLFDKPGVYRTTQLPLLVERARIHTALEQWEQAERDIEDFFRLSNPKTQEGPYYSGACLVRGFLRERRGDTAGAKASWHQDEDALAALDPHFGHEFLYGMIRAALADDMTDARAEVIIKRVTDALSASDARLATSFVRVIHLPPSAIREIWRTPRGRDYARKIAFQSISFDEIISVGPRLLLAELLHQGAWQGPLSADEDALLWKLVGDFFSAYVDGQMKMGQMVSLGLAWKGTSGILGWGSLAPTLPPARRGPLAYVLGRRYASVHHKPTEAASFFRTALADAGSDERLRRLAQMELDRMKSK